MLIACSILINFVEFAVIAKLQPKPEGDTNNKNGKEGKEKQPRREETKAAIMQSLRTKLNNLIQEDGKYLICI